VSHLIADGSERAVLGAAIRNPDRLPFLEVETSQEDFTGVYRPRLRSVVLGLSKKQVPLSFDLVESAYLAETHSEEAAGEIDAIRTEVTASDAWQWHLDQIRSAAVRRRLTRLSEELAKAATEGASDEDLLVKAQQMSASAGRLEVRDSQVISGSDATAEVKTDYFAGKSGYIHLSMGPQTYPFRGLRPGEVFTVLAKTWVGKSLWASQVTINANVPTLVVSLEMPRVQWWERTVMQALASSRSDITSRLATGQLHQTEYSRLAALEKRIALCDRCDGSLPALEAAVKRSEAVLGVQPKLVVIDYLQLLNVAARGATLYQKTSEAAIEVKRLAKRLGIAIMLLSQISRKDGVDGGSDVSLESARDSGMVEEAADFLLGLWRPCLKKGLSKEEYDLKEPQMRGRLLKNRRGRAFEWNFQLNTSNLQIQPE
jgi:replicative DNA helicase